MRWTLRLRPGEKYRQGYIAAPMTVPLLGNTSTSKKICVGAFRWCMEYRYAQQADVDLALVFA